MDQSCFCPAKLRRTAAILDKEINFWFRTSLIFARFLTSMRPDLFLRKHKQLTFRPPLFSFFDLLLVVEEALKRTFAALSKQFAV